MNVVKAIISGLIFITISSATTSCSHKQHNYYGKLSIDGVNTLKGRYPLSEKEAKSTSYYHFIYNNEGQPVIVEYLKRGNLSQDSDYKISRILIEYTGDYEKRSFVDSQGRPAMSKDGVFSISLKKNSHGFSIALFNYGVDGKLTSDIFGVVQYSYEVDKNGNRIKTAYLNENGERITPYHGEYENRKSYDRNNRQIERVLYDKDGKLFEDTYGAAIYRYRYDRNDNIIEENFYGADGQPKIMMKFGAAKILKKYDDRGNTLEVKCYGTDGQLNEGLGNFGASIIKWNYDKYDNVVEWQYFGSDEKLKEREDLGGVAILRLVYDEDGNISGGRCFNSHEQLIDEKVCDAAVNEAKSEIESTNNRPKLVEPISNDDINFYEDYIAPSSRITRLSYVGPKRDPRMKASDELVVTSSGITILRTTPPVPPYGSMIRKEIYEWHDEKLCISRHIPMNKITEDVDQLMQKTIPEPDHMECPFLKTAHIGSQWTDEMYDYRVVGYKDIPLSFDLMNKVESKSHYETINVLVIERKSSDEYLNGYNQRHPEFSQKTDDPLRNKWVQEYYAKGIGYVGIGMEDSNSKIFWASRPYRIIHN